MRTSFHYRYKQLLELETLRGEIKFKLEEQFSGRLVKFQDGYVTHITIGYLKKEIVYFRLYSEKDIDRGNAKIS